MVKEISGWEEFQEKGDGYLNLAVKAQNRPDKFNPDLIYNISSMAIENLVMAFLARRGLLPDNHTLWDLANALEDTLGIEKAFKHRLLKMGNFQEICSLMEYRRRIPTWDDVKEFVDLVQEVKRMLERETAPLSVGG